MGEENDNCCTRSRILYDARPWQGTKGNRLATSDFTNFICEEKESTKERRTRKKGKRVWIVEGVKRDEAVKRDVVGGADQINEGAGLKNTDPMKERADLISSTGQRQPPMSTLQRTRRCN
jgi:hypothetical protein